MLLEIPDDAPIPLVALIRFFQSYGYTLKAHAPDHLEVVPSDHAKNASSETDRRETIRQ